MKKELVVKDNALINASYHLSLVEQRLILLAISEARESDKGINANDPLSIKAESYTCHFGVGRQAAYMALKEACEALFERRFSYVEHRKGGRARIKSRWVSQIGYLDNKATVELIFSPAVVPLITHLEKRFTSYELKQISDLTSGYAIRLYEVLIAWRSQGKTPIIELKELRNRLSVLENEYARMDVFKKGVLDTAINQINQHTDIKTTYAQHKQGRRIVGFSFTLKQKKAKSPQAPKNKPRQAAPESLREHLEKSGVVL